MIQLEILIQEAIEITKSEKQNFFEDRRFVDKQQDVLDSKFIEIEHSIQKLMEKLTVLKENLNNKKKEYDRGIIVPSIHSQILPIIIDVYLSDSAEDLQKNLFRL